VVHSIANPSVCGTLEIALYKFKCNWGGGEASKRKWYTVIPSGKASKRKWHTVRPFGKAPHTHIKKLKNNA